MPDVDMSRYLPRTLFGVLTLAALVFAGNAGADNTTTPDVAAILSGEVYLPSGDPLADLEAKLAIARDDGKRLLVIAGGNWCHDSRALGARLFTAPLESVIDTYYETLFVDVGYLDKGMDVLDRLGVPIYFATPTVLIIDPVSGQLVNADNRHQWGHAADIGMDASVAYFSQYAGTGQTVPVIEADSQLQTLLTDIDGFERQQALRLSRAYAVVGPMLKAYKEGDKDAFSEKLWNEVRDYRLQVPADLDALRNEARARVAAGESHISLDYPAYPPFSWETD
jgi:hypothetical protein